MEEVDTPLIGDDVELGAGVIIRHPDQVNLYGCRIGDGTKIASFVEIQRGVVVGRAVKIEPFAFIPTGVCIEDEVFIGPHVCFTNDLYPSAAGDDGEPLGVEDWEVIPTVVRRGASIGANATIVCGITIGERAMVAAGAIVTRDVPAGMLVMGTPARVVRALPGDGRDCPDPPSRGSTHQDRPGLGDPPPKAPPSGRTSRREIGTNVT